MTEVLFVCAACGTPLRDVDMTWDGDCHKCGADLAPEGSAVAPEVWAERVAAAERAIAEWTALNTPIRMDTPDMMPVQDGNQ